jgi:peptidoglycan/LPS O-acetylase OafA/YrhL
MAVTYFAVILLQETRPDAITIGINLLFLNQVFTTTSMVGAAWTLSLEFWLYCLTPCLMMLSNRSIRWTAFGSFACYLVYTALRTLWHLPYYAGTGFGANLILLSFVWLAGLRLVRSSREDKSALRDIGLIFTVHIGLGFLIQLGYRFKHHDLGTFISQDLVDYLMQSATLLLVFLIFKHLVVVERPAVKRSRFLRMLGDISYPLYVLHIALYGIFTYFGLKMPALFYLLAVLVSAGVYWSLDIYSKRRHLTAALS